MLRAFVALGIMLVASLVLVARRRARARSGERALAEASSGSPSKEPSDEDL